MHCEQRLSANSRVHHSNQRRLLHTLYGIIEANQSAYPKHSEHSAPIWLLVSFLLPTYYAHSTLLTKQVPQIGAQQVREPMDRQSEQHTDQEAQHYGQGETVDRRHSPPLPSSELEESNSLISQPDAPHEQLEYRGRARHRFSRRRLIIAGSVTAGGLVIASSLGVLGLQDLLRQQGQDILGSFLLGKERQPPPNMQGPMTTPQDIVIFSGRLNTGWQDWSWGQHQIVTSPAFTDGSPVIKFSPANNGGVYFSHTPIETSGFGYFQFWINGGAVGGQQLSAGVADQTYSFTPAASVNNYIQGGFVQLNQWRLVRIPLAAVQGADTPIGGVIISDATGTSQPDVFLADLRLVHILNPNEPTLLSGDAPDLNAILLFFDRQMRLDEVQATHFYQISSLEDHRFVHPIYPASAQYQSGNKSVSLLVPGSMQAGKRYVVSVGRIHSVDGPALADASNVTVTAQPLEITVDISNPGLAISPYIYGLNFSLDVSAQYLNDLRPKLNRWGGEQTTRYNWKLGNAFNAADNYYFQNGNYGHNSPADRQPSGLPDQFITANRNAGTDSMLTIPTIGWVPKDDLPTSASINVGDGGPPISPGSDTAVYQGRVYNPAANRRRTSVPSRARKGQPFSDPPNLADPTVAQDEWVYHLVNRFGQASNGGVRIYEMDNEYDLWFLAHRDVRPVEVGYDELLSIFLDYATAVKDVDPTAQIAGPVSWGWPNYFYSALDRSDNNFKTLPDYHAHHDVPLLAWFLQQVRQHDESTGRRTLDVLDIHFFPQASEYRGGVDASSRALRLRSTRALWDPTYKDESWINDYVDLIPRMRNWIAQNYPGTKLAISEYNWGGETIMNGALAEAEVLGIFSREGVDIACYWAYPAAYSPPYYAFKLYSNYDNKGSWFGGTSLPATSTRLDTLSCYAAEQKNGDVLLMLLNKHEQEALTPTIHLPHLAPRQVIAYRYGPDPKLPIAQLEDQKLTNQTLLYTLPPNSITLLVLKKE